MTHRQGDASVLFSWCVCLSRVLNCDSCVSKLACQCEGETICNDNTFLRTHVCICAKAQVWGRVSGILLDYSTVRHFVTVLTDNI